MLESYLAAIVESSDDAIFGLTPEGLVMSWNPGAEKLYGYRAEEIIGQHINLLIPPEDQARVAENFERLRAGERVISYEAERVGKGGAPVHVSVKIFPVTDGEGRNIGIGAIARDMTERRRLEEQLRQAQKIEAVGRLAGGVAHDFNNLLTAINGYSDLALRHVAPDNPLRSNLEEVRKAGERAAALTSQLLAFSRKQVWQPRVLDLNLIIADMDKMLRRLIGEDILLNTVTDPALGRVKADAGQLEQVLMNLAVNARDAMPRGGRLTVETANVCLDENYARTRPYAAPGHYVMLAVSDTGTGMDRQTAAQIFEPFFTTKEPGRGTGLGLSTVYGIVKQSGGHIEVDSEPGRGTSFRAYLPRCEEGAGETEAPPRPAGTSRGRESVLLVEDEEMVRELAGEILRACGYEVFQAVDGGEALAVCGERAGRIDLLLTDVVMPGMSGRELAEHLLALRPDLRVLYMSGYTDDAVVRHGVLQEGARFLQKPFTPDTLARKVRQVLDEAA